MQRLLHVGQPAFNLRNNLHEVIDIETAAGGTGYNGNAPRAQPERLYNLPGNAHFFLRLRGEGNTNRIAYSFVQEYAQTN